MARDVPGEVCTGDSLRADAFGGRTFDAVICHPPFGATNWGDEELGHDSRWIVGTTPRTEPKLAWAQHGLAHLRAGGHRTADATHRGVTSEGALLGRNLYLLRPNPFGVSQFKPSRHSFD